MQHERSPSHTEGNVAPQARDLVVSVGRIPRRTAVLERMQVHGFRTLVETDVDFDPLTIMIGKNGAGKTSILDALQLIGNFARGGVNRAFGPPPWSLGWQRTKGIGTIHAIQFDVQVRVNNQRYRYRLSLNESNDSPRVEEERLTRLDDHTTVASFDYRDPPPSGTILNPGEGVPFADEIGSISRVFRSVVSYELNPSVIERGNDPEHAFIGRDGFGVAGFLANLKDNNPGRFASLEDRLRRFRPETEAIDVWASGRLFWGLRDQSQPRAFPAVHLSWGDRQLVGLLCVLYSTDSGSTIAIEEIDRGFHHSRYVEVIELLSEAAYDGIDGAPPMQIVITTHSPAFVNKLSDRLSEIRMVTRVPGGGTIIHPLKDLVHEKLGPGELAQPLGEIWEMGLLEDVIHEALS